MIKMLLASLPMLIAFGYILYDNLKKRYNKKKEVAKAKVELINLLTIQPCIDMASVTHSIEIRLTSTDSLLNGHVFTVWCKNIHGAGWYFNPIVGRWSRFSHMMDISESMFYCLPSKYRGGAFHNSFRRISDLIEIPTLKPSKKPFRHSFTH